jgi:hypothetical protein
VGAPLDNDIRSKLEDKAFPLWALRKYQQQTGRTERSALEYIIERWAVVDPSAKTYGITLRHFEQEAERADVVKFSERRDGGS